MSEEKLDPMDARLLERLRAHAPAHRAPDDAFARVSARLALTIPTLQGDGGAGPSHGSTHSSTGAARIATQTVGRAGGLATTKLAVAMAVAAATGGGVGAAWMHAAEEPRERIVYVDRPAASTPARAPTESTPEPTRPADSAALLDISNLQAAAESSTSRSPRAPGSSLRPVSASTDDVAAERTLLDDGRTALARGDAMYAISAMDKHRARYPKGVLSEEREALAVRALVTLGRTAEAKQRAARFRAEHPTSLLLPAVEAAVADGAGAP